MKKILIVCMLTFIIAINNYTSEKSKDYLTYNGEIFLYGETHGNEKILKKEFEIWSEYYKKGMRNLFIELPYYTGEYLNIWMKEDNDEILNQLFTDSIGTAGNTPEAKVFYKKIKEFCPETIFYGTDVGHQYDTTGYRYLNYLEENNLKSSQKYTLTKEAINQGIEYYGPPQDHIYRENMMVKNFINRIKPLEDKDIMGIYGGAHTGLNGLISSGKVPNMANQLNSLIKGNITSIDLRPLAKDIEPLRIDEVDINGNVYSAYYYGEQDLTGFKNYRYRKFWKIDNGYEDFKLLDKTGEYLPAHNYPMNLEINTLYLIEYGYLDGSLRTSYYLSEGIKNNNKMITENIDIPN